MLVFRVDIEAFIIPVIHTVGIGQVLLARPQFSTIIYTTVSGRMSTPGSEVEISERKRFLLCWRICSGSSKVVSDGWPSRMYR